MRHEVIEADLTWIDGRFQSDVSLSISADGRVSAIDRPTAPRAPTESVQRSDHSAHRRLRGAALIPGFVNSHSHAFQRGLRGLGESFPKGAGDFFTWREAMYALVERLDVDSAYSLSRDAFDEMLDAGYTTCGEFHYVRHLSDDARFALDEAVIGAAIDSGIRVVLLHTAYESGGIGQPLRGGQRRFETRGVDDYWSAHERLATLLRGAPRSLASLGVVAHSVRAVPWPTIALLRRGALDRGEVFHMHVEEVVREVEECLAHHGRRPMQMVVDELEPDERFTAVHCTHTAPEDMRRYGAARATVCLCPSTEGNLGDGIADIPGMRSAGASIAFGTDLNARLCPFEELRWMEYVQRVARRQRGVIVDEAGESAPALVSIGTRGGARSLGVDAGEIRVGAWADFTAIDLEQQALAGATPETLVTALVFGAGGETTLGTCVGGQWRARRGARRTPW